MRDTVIKEIKLALTELGKRFDDLNKVFVNFDFIQLEIFIGLCFIGYFVF